jgi:hypothetical protein
MSAELSGRMREASDLEDQGTESNAGFAVQRGLPGGQMRQSVTIHQRLILPDQLRVLAKLCGSEPHWLDWALEQLGVSQPASFLSPDEPTLRLPGAEGDDA